MSNFVSGSGNGYSKLLILGEAPGATEDREGKPFVGASGDILNEIFTELGHEDWRSKFYTTNVYKYRPPYNQIKRISEVCDPNEQRILLEREIEQVNPNCILALGGTALYAAAGYDKILTYRGSILPTANGLRKVVGSIHPANITRASNDSGDYYQDFKIFPYIWKHILKADIERAITESSSSRLEYPQRLLRIARSSAEVYSFVRRIKGYDRVYADIETFRCTLPSCIGIGFDGTEALSIPMFRRIGDIEFTTMPHAELANIWQILFELFASKEVAGANWKFDEEKMRMLGFRFKGLKSDVQLKEHTINPELPRKGLDMLASLRTREPYYKDEGKEFHYGKHKIDRLYLYNGKDVGVTADVDADQEKELEELSVQYKTDLKAFYYNYVVKLHTFYFDMEQVGFCVDEGVKSFLKDKYEHWMDSLKARLQAKAGSDFNPNSHVQVKDFIYGPLQLPEQKFKGKVKSDEDAISNILKKIKDDYRREALNDILEYRRVSKTLSTYVNARVDFDGKLRSQYRITGTETGRSSTSLLDEPVRPYESGFAFQTLTKHGDIGADIRSYLVPEKGYVFLNVDLSQAEARIVALLSNDLKLLEAFDKIDIHRRTAGLALITGRLNLSLEFDKTCDSLGKDSAERFVGKKVRHAGNYNMQAGTFLQNVVSDARRFHIDIDMSPFRAKQALDRFHAASPNIRGVFHEEITQVMSAERALINPFGRLRRFFGRWDDALLRESFATIPQGTVKDHLVQAAMKFKEERMHIPYIKRLYVGESHDALLMQVKEDEVQDIAKGIKPILETPIDFSNCSIKRGKLIIPCDFEVGDNYKDLEKLKFAA